VKETPRIFIFSEKQKQKIIKKRQWSGAWPVEIGFLYANFCIFQLFPFYSVHFTLFSPISLSFPFTLFDLSLFLTLVPA
jgi:hypothetical protein